MSKITRIETTTDKELSENIAALEKAARMVPAMIEYSVIKAKVNRSYYLSLLESGFDEKQALYLTKNNE